MKIACLLLAVTSSISCHLFEQVNKPASTHQKVEQVVYMFPRDSKNLTPVQNSLQDAYSARREFDPFLEDGRRETEAAAMREALACVGVNLDKTDEILIFPDMGCISIKARGETLAKIDKILIRFLVIPPDPKPCGRRFKDDEQTAPSNGEKPSK